MYSQEISLDAGVHSTCSLHSEEKNGTKVIHIFSTATGITFH